MEVKLLCYTNLAILENIIGKCYGHGYHLVGSVTIGANNNGNTIYLATMIKEKQ